MKREVMALGFALAAVATPLGYETYMRATASTYFISADPVRFPDDRALVAYADHVFLGHVTRALGFSPSGTLPQTRFEVSVIQQIKGTLPPTVTLTQIGGTDRFGNTWVIKEEPLLALGMVYLFATRTAEDPHFGHRPIPESGRIAAPTHERQQRLVERFARVAAEVLQKSVAPRRIRDKLRVPHRQSVDIGGPAREAPASPRASRARAGAPGTPPGGRLDPG